MKNKVNLFQNYCVKKFEHLSPQIVEVMKQVFTTFSILSIAILVLSCQKKDLLDVNPLNEINHNNTFISAPSVDTINQTLSFNLQESFSLLLNPGKGFIKYYNLYQFIFIMPYIFCIFRHGKESRIGD
jgi:hypothetical protein